jgi:hypothetical protein
MRDIIIDTIVLALISSLYIAEGLRLLLAKKPLLVEHRWWAILGFGPVAVLYTGTTLRFAYIEMEQSWLSALLVICWIAIAICLGIAWWSSRGGIVIGVTETTLRDVLRQAFSRQGLSYEESAEAFRLPALNNELIVKAVLFDGMFSVYLKRLRNRRAFRQLAPEVNEFLRTAPVRINKRVGYALVVLGVAFLLINSLVTYKRLSLRARMRAMEEGHTEVFKPSEK